MNTKTRANTLAVAGVVLLFATGCVNASSLPNPFRPPSPTSVVPVDLPLPAQQQLRDYDLAIRALREQYVSPKALEGTWVNTVSEHRARIARGVSDSAFALALQETLAALNDDDLSLTTATSAVQSTAPATATATAAFSGIGVRVDLPRQGRERILILHVYPDSPAESAGLKAHDAIIAIEGDAVKFSERATVTSRLRGQTGTSVRVTIRTPGQQPREVTLTRKPIRPTEATVSKRIEGTSAGYIRPGMLGGDDLRLELVEALRKLSSEGDVQSLVLDLRTMQSPEFPLDNVLGLFANGQVGTRLIRALRNREKIELTGKNIGGSQVLPMAVLVSDQTQGPAEALAGILQDIGRAKVIGNKTPGRVAVLGTVNLPNTGLLMGLPIGEIRGNKDNTWYKTGLAPDMLSDKLWEEFTTENDPQLNEAVRVLGAR